MPAKTASSMAGSPSLVPGILMRRFGRPARACRVLAAPRVLAVSWASSGDTSSDTQPSPPCVRAADLFRPIWDRTHGVDGWVSLEVSPLLAHDTASTLAAAKTLHARAGRPNLLIKIPGTKEGLPAIEEAVFAGIPINVTLLFSSAHYLAAADAFMREQ